MQLPRDAVLLRIFVGEDDKFQQLPLYEAIVLKARAMHVTGPSSRLHTTKLLRLSQDLPLVIDTNGSCHGAPLSARRLAFSSSSRETRFGPFTMWCRNPNAAKAAIAVRPAYLVRPFQSSTIGLMRGSFGRFA
jgi:Uncharacterized ACR, COG1993